MGSQEPRIQVQRYASLHFTCSQSVGGELEALQIHSLFTFNLREVAKVASSFD